MYRLCIIALCLLLAWPAEGRERSARKAFWASLLVPGWGQYYAGKSESGLRFLAAELSLWGGYVAFGRVAAMRRDNYRTYAAAHARARPQGKGKEYFDDLGFYQSRLQHNRFALYDDGPEAVLYERGAEFFWEWDAEASRMRYRDLRNASETAERQALFATGLVVVNHLIAAIHAAREVRAGERVDETDWRMELGRTAGGGLNVGVQRRF